VGCPSPRGAQRSCPRRRVVPALGQGMGMGVSSRARDSPRPHARRPAAAPAPRRGGSRPGGQRGGPAGPGCRGCPRQRPWLRGGRGSGPQSGPCDCPPLPPPSSKLHGPRDTLNRGSMFGQGDTCAESQGAVSTPVCMRVTACVTRWMSVSTRVCRAGCLWNHTTTQCARVCPRRHGCVNTHTRMCRHRYVSTHGHIWQSPTCTRAGGRARA